MSRIDVIIPCYNSMHSIRTVVEGILENLSEKHNVRVLLTNDNSPDRVWDEIQKLCLEHTNIIGINLSRNFGQQAARMAAMKYVEGEFIVFMDDDGQHDSKYIQNLIEKIEEGFDIVYASFEKKKQARWKTLGSGFHQITAEWFEEKPKGIHTSSFFIVRRYIVDQLKEYTSPSPVLFGYLMKTTQNIGCVTVPHNSRIEGTSGYTLKKLIRLWLNAVTSFSIVPLKFSSYLGFLSATIGIFALTIIVIKKLVYPQIPTGYTSTIAVILLFDGIILLILGLIGEYLGKMFMTINNVPQYVIKDVLNKNEE